MRRQMRTKKQPRTALAALRSCQARLRELRAGDDASAVRDAEATLEALLPAAIEELQLSSHSGLPREALERLLRGGGA